MNAKSLSPRIKFDLKKSKIVLQKLGSMKNFSPLYQNESVNNISGINSQTTLGTSQKCSKLQLSNSKLNLKLKSPPSSFKIPRSTKLKVMAEKYYPQKSFKAFQDIPTESLLPLSSSETNLRFSNYLSKFEVNELSAYDTIYYLGLRARKILPNEKLQNKGFDDKETDYYLILGDHLAYQYEILELLGSGSFSQVCKCLDHKNNKEVAVKILKSHKRFEEQGLIELRILNYLKKHNKTHPEQFVQILDHFVFRGHLCVVFELLSFNLYDLLKANGFKGFSNNLVRRFAVQVLNGLRFLAEHRIVHCDLKPENIILINPHESLVKIIDFGSSCFEDEKIYYYIQSRIYRAPEVILGVPYTTAIDIWSFGCIIAELLNGDPIFQGDSEVDQLNTIIEVIGYPPETILSQSAKKEKFFNPDGSIKTNTNSKGKLRIPSSKSLELKLKTDDFVLIDLISSKKYLECLEWDPKKRISAEEALDHPWLSEIKKIRIKGNKLPRSPRLKIS